MLYVIAIYKRKGKLSGFRLIDNNILNIEDITIENMYK